MITTCSRILRLTKSRRWVWNPNSGDWKASHAVRRRFVDTSQITVHRSCFSMAVHDSDASLPSSGSAQEVRSPDSPVLSRRCDSLTPVALHFVAFEQRYHCSTRTVLRSRRHRVHSLRRAWSLVTRQLRPGIVQVETSGSPKFPWSLLCSFAHVHATPAGRTFLTFCETHVLPPLIQLRGLRRQYCRGSVTWLSNSLRAPSAAWSASWCRLPIPHARLAPGCWSGLDRKSVV